jgi:hypothetical protein
LSARAAVTDAVRRGRLDDLAALAAADRRTLRHILALAYRPEPEIRTAAGRAIAAASRHYPELVQEMARRLLWAMNDESGTHALTAPEVLRAIAEESPDLLLPLLSELLRLTADPGLHDALVDVARLVAARNRSGAAATVATALNACATRGGKT